MTVKETIWLVFLLNMAGHIVLYYLLPYISGRIEENRKFRQEVLELTRQGLSDNVEIGQMINGLKSE